ncbi:MAG TPA: NUDIX domain-containing protein [Candidatus Saccharibacteria bacterium]|jgi:ADP-ribose pyrophosphatase YjhB (NUDIX family)|nr:NUDIX domain-containing protein [Candidatus Saccharibacteria bacterium]
MRKAARAIIVENNRILVMRRLKAGNQYYTLVGGGIKDDETMEQGVAREVKEETGLDVTSAQLVYVELHPEPYNEQYIFLCQVAPHAVEISVAADSEEQKLATHSMQGNVHTPLWVDFSSFPHLAFRTPQLQEAIIKALKKGFPKQPVRL